MQTRSQQFSLTAKDYSFNIQFNKQGGSEFEFLGSGAFANAYKGCYFKNNSSIAVAIKVSKAPYSWIPLNKILDTFKQEQFIYQKIEEARKQAPSNQISNYSHLIRYYGSQSNLNLFYCNPWNIALVLEYAPRGSLFDWVQNEQFTWAMRYQVIKHIAQALLVLEKLNIIHGDVKIENVFLDENMNGKLGDFGLSKEKDEALDDYGTPYNKDPQQLQGSEPRNYALDIWALGIIIYELFTMTKSYSAFYITNLQELCNVVVDYKQRNQITIPNHHTLIPQLNLQNAQQNLETIHAQQLNRVFSINNEKQNDSDHVNMKEVSSLPLKLEKEQAELVVRQAEQQLRQVTRETQKADLMLAWCCQFHRKDRPTAQNLLQTALFQPPDKIDIELQQRATLGKK